MAIKNRCSTSECLYYGGKYGNEALIDEFLIQSNVGTINTYMSLLNGLVETNKNSITAHLLHAIKVITNNPKRKYDTSKLYREVSRHAGYGGNLSALKLLGDDLDKGQAFLGAAEAGHIGITRELFNSLKSDPDVNDLFIEVSKNVGCRGDQEAINNLIQLGVIDISMAQYSAARCGNYKILYYLIDNNIFDSVDCNEVVDMLQSKNNEVSIDIIKRIRSKYNC